MTDLIEYFHRRPWDSQDVVVYVISEENAIRAAIEPVMERFRNPHGSAVGFSSLTFGRDTALNVVSDDKPIIVYQLGDHDPSGVVAWNAFENGLRSHPNGEDVTFTRLAVERESEYIQGWYRNERFTADPNLRD